MKQPPENPRVALATLGCKVNQYESAALGEAIERLGFQAVSFTEEADCYIINTCTVTGRTDYQSRQMIRRALRRNPGALIVVTGCYAQTNLEELAKLPNIAVIAGNREKSSLPDIIARAWKQKKDGPSEPLPQRIHLGAFQEGDSLDVPLLKHFSGHTRAFLKIQDGCNAFCSYCIVPHARGRSRSLQPEIVREHMLAMAKAGYREIVLTGIHLGTYGQDLTPRTTLLHLLQQIEDQGIIQRLRLSSIEPQEISEDLLRLFKKAAIICPHLHIPLQSGDDEILSRMNRHYSRDFFRSLVEKVMISRPDTAVGLDVMVGFPGEDESAFQQTYRLIEDLPVAYLHVFPFSKRPGTPAQTMQNQVKEDEKKRRAEQLRLLGNEKRRLFMMQFIGQRLHVLVEGRRDKKTGCWMGFSENYLPVALANGRSGLVNTVVTVIPTEMNGNVLSGEVIDE